MTNHNSLTIAVRKALVCAIAPAAVVSFMAHAQDDSTEMETITVTAQALKVETLAKETPRSVSIISEDELRVRAPQKLDEALRYTSGVTSQPYGADNDTDWFKVRGFDAATYLNGNRLFRDGYYTWLVEPYGLESVEVVKGPSAILFGESAPGGVVNAVQKKPTFTPQGEVKVEVGNNNHQSIGFDIADEANDSGTMRYRLVGLMTSQDGELDDTENERFYIAPSLEIDVSDRTMLTLMATYLKDDGVPTNPFFPAAGTLVDSEYGKIDPSTNLGEPDYDKYERTQISLGYLLEHDINDTWTFSQNANYGSNELFLRSVYSMPSPGWDLNDDSLYYRGIVFRDGKNQSFTFDNNAVGNWMTDNAEHTVLVGVDLQYHNTKGDEQDNYSFGTVNPFNPSYGNYTPLDSADNIKREIDKYQASVYSQYQLKFHEQWIGNVGARYDWVKTENSGKGASVDQSESRDDGELSLSAGLMYLAENGLSPYANYSQSFEVISTIDTATGKLYKPLEGEQVEVGVKYEPSFMDGFVNIAWFDITQKNALVTNPSTWVATQTGEVTSTGVEVEGTAQLTDDVKLLASYTYTKAETDETYGKGTQQAGLIPKHQASAWVDYSAYRLIPGLNVGTGVRYVGESKDNPASSDLTVPSVTLWDASVTYDISSQWQAQLNVNNILDKEFISGCDYYCYFGQSRSVMLNANYRW
ncbi:TonB-dependent siderophore receptor [Vibrio natriegens]|uniref:Ligand-gated channel n=1 Tax=Vibrio natriegens NBRC 15636 = ATCC 14048 = DSM 759 TaxID=1219067 RepID=A0AAN0Y6N2_VIBNA|nr:TonB-dependent siderophore receptor [Vibrio natriegens]ALR17327.1 ligand-gated channel [Vibrio natriegens NBRC 15636 = ATCC 14048 = DSM 759]ANQ14819.1 ligand-gated channel [Vibrio natriegens NBRC 15636 = ATCC 14048 = DSM 759]EPM39871.1 ligand-gated channel [Vibrio natriegens NBRC 15636 = ATCC 14048 = DSM 759]MDX6029862.1 TonB-dependent siderophore receptor [Vibrio natriegens NBRC 15636 = ATCC 14048 = DSM 759]UUI13456.1 TonB-dependent siderophore receptor [Vibrio natriegens]